MPGLPLAGRRVLVPRGGEFGERLSLRLRTLGAEPVIAPLIEFSPPENTSALDTALQRLIGGAYDWLAITSATTVDALGDRLAQVPGSTRVAAVGTATAEALRAHGVTVSFVPSGEQSAAGLLAEWPAGGTTALLAQSEIAAGTLADGLTSRGLAVDVVTAYRTSGVAIDEGVRETIWAGAIDAILLTSGSTARQLKAQCAPIPSTTAIVCIGASTAAAATSVGLHVTAVAERSDGASLIDALVDLMA
jgi:uroporphyrinogen-III synthase